MAKGIDNSEKAILGSATVHKTSAFGVDDDKWYIALCKSTRERTIRDQLLKANYQAYIASQVETHVYKSRNRRQVETVVIPAKIFIRTKESELVNILYNFSSIYKFMLNPAGIPNEYGGKPYATVSDAEMQRLQYILNNAEKPVLFTEEPLHLGERVKVVRGSLSGLEGNYIYRKNTIYIALELVLGTKTLAVLDVPLSDIQHIP